MVKITNAPLADLDKIIEELTTLRTNHLVSRGYLGGSSHCVATASRND
jgi:hypothetical protein